MAGKQFLFWLGKSWQFGCSCAFGMALALFTSCAPAICPTNQAASAPPGTKGSPAKSAGTLDKNGRFQKKNAYHPSARYANQ
jgi:hypothetical protein